MTEFYIGQNVFAEIDGQIVRLRNKFGVTITFDVGGIGILHSKLSLLRQQKYRTVDSSERALQRMSSRTSPFQP